MKQIFQNGQPTLDDVCNIFEWTILSSPIDILGSKASLYTSILYDRKNKFMNILSTERYYILRMQALLKLMLLHTFFVHKNRKFTIGMLTSYPLSWIFSQSHLIKNVEMSERKRGDFLYLLIFYMHSWIIRLHL